MRRDRTIHVTIRDVEWLDNRLRVSADVSGHPGWRLHRRNGLLFFDIPEPWAERSTVQGKPDDVHDAFLRATIFSAMEAGRPMVVHGAVSRSLLENLEAYQQIIHRWWPWYRPVPLSADVERDAPAGPHAARNAAILGFSGGLDSCYSLYRHARRGEDPPHPLSACVFVHGFDIPLVDEAGYRGALERARRITEDLGVPLIPVRSNLRSMLPWWPHSHGAALAATLSLFGVAHSVGLIAGSNFSKECSDHEVSEGGFGSTGRSDPLLSSQDFSVVHDGVGVMRIEKTAVLRDWPAARRNLRVCWEGRNAARNCGRCEKCVRQMLCMRAVGIDDLSAFDGGLTPELIRNPRGWRGALFFRHSNFRAWRQCYEHARQAGTAEQPEMLALKKVLDEMTVPRFNMRGWASRQLTTLVSRIY